MSVVLAHDVCCREIGAADIEAVIALLHRSFPSCSPAWLTRVFARLTTHRTPRGLPKYGYMIEAHGQPVGVILVIFAEVQRNGVRIVRGNTAFWYVDPQYRSYAYQLSRRAKVHRNITYIDITPARHTWPMLAAQGFRAYAPRQFAAITLFGRRPPGARVEAVTSASTLPPDLSPFEAQLLSDHAGYGCTSVTCTFEGRTHPFVFTTSRSMRWKKIPLTYVGLAYCRDQADFIQFSGPLGWFLARRGIALVFMDVDGPVDGLVGKYLDWGPKFYRGAAPPPLGDLAYTERVMFDL